MELIITTPLRKDALNISWLELNTPEGNLIVQEGHAPMILTLSKDSEIVYSLASGTKHSRFAVHAIAEITRKTVTIIMQES